MPGRELVDVAPLGGVDGSEGYRVTAQRCCACLNF